MKYSVFHIATILGALSLVAGQSSIKLRRYGAEEDMYKMDNIDRQAKFVVAKYASNAQAYFRNTGKHHTVVNGTTLSRRANSGELELQMLNAATWIGEVEIGSPGQKQGVMFDSGSPNIVIGRNSYKPEDSSTSKDLDKSFEVTYLGPAAEGSIYTDVVTVAGVKAKHVAIGSSGSNFMNAKKDEDLVGIFGLSYPSLGSFGVPDKNTYIGATKNQKIFYDDIFQFHMRRLGESYLNVGKIDMNRVDGDIAWVDVDKSEGYWKADVEINGQKSSGIIDSGTTFIFGKNEDVKKILDGIDGVEVKKSDSGDWQGFYKCDSPPEIKLKVAGKEVTMDAEAIIAGRDGNQCKLCIAGIHGAQSWIFGADFFQMYTVIFDFEKERMGFGKQKN